jgi:hypothetical protein
VREKRKNSISILARLVDSLEGGFFEIQRSGENGCGSANVSPDKARRWTLDRQAFIPRDDEGAKALPQKSLRGQVFLVTPTYQFAAAN